MIASASRVAEVFTVSNSKSVPTRYHDFEFSHDRATLALRGAAKPSDFGFEVVQQGEFIGNLTNEMRQHGVQHGMQFDVTRQGQPMGASNQGSGQYYGSQQPKLVDVPFEKPEKRDDLHFQSKNRFKPF